MPPLYTENQLNAKTKVELLKIAENMGIGGISSHNLKVEIIEAIMKG